MESKLFDRLKESMASFNDNQPFDIPVGEYVEQPAMWADTVNKSHVYSMEYQCRVMREVYAYPPKSQVRHRWIAYYLQTFCSSFCGVIYDPLKEDAPLVTFTDTEGDMRWFEVLLDKMHNCTKEEVTTDVSGTIMELFFKSELDKVIEDESKVFFGVKVTD
jgi:hypothetical protein